MKDDPKPFDSAVPGLCRAQFSFTVKDWSSKKIDEELCLPVFDLAGRSWQVQLYPAGRTIDPSARHPVAFLRLLPDDKCGFPDLTVPEAIVGFHFSYSEIPSSEACSQKPSFSVLAPRHGEFVVAPPTAIEVTLYWVMEVTGGLPGSVAVEPTIQRPSFAFQALCGAGNAIDNSKTLYEPDFTIKFASETFSAHRFVLAAASPGYFGAMFANSLLEERDRKLVVSQELSEFAEEGKLILRWMYGHMAKDIFQQPMARTAIWRLAELASYWDVGGFLADLLTSNISLLVAAATFVDTFARAADLNIPFLQELVLLWVKKSGAKITEREDGVIKEILAHSTSSRMDELLKAVMAATR